MTSTTILTKMLMLAIASITLTVSPAACQSLPGAWITGGIATFYGGAPDGMDPNSPSFGTKEGACGYGLLDKNSWPGWDVVGIATSNRFFSSLPGNACGACFEIQCVDARAGACNPATKSVTVTVTDKCPECGADHWDLQALVFARFATPAVGRVAIQYRRVACTPPKDVEVQIDNNRGSGGWLRLFVQDVANLGTVSRVSVGSSGTWTPLTNVWGSAWEISTLPPPPLDLKIVDEAGMELLARGVIRTDGQVGIFPTGVNFAFDGSGSSNTAVTALAGPPPATNVTTPAPAPAPRATAPSTTTSAGCNDVHPPSSPYTCDEQKAYGKCQESWMTVTSTDTPQGYCAQTCGRCVSTAQAPVSLSLAAVSTTNITLASTNTSQPSTNNTSSPSPASASPSPAATATPSPSPGSTTTPSPASTTPSPPTPSPVQCSDTAPDNQYTCQQQQQFGKCSESWMIAGGFCRRTCGRC